ncbi:MAG: CdaR family protein [Spirochaetes bacterium]|nr:CdaR family protein [Spirochaetota bacterium]
MRKSLIINLIKHIFSDIKENYKAFIVCVFASVFIAYFINTLNYEEQVLFSEIELKNLDSKYIVRNIENKKVKIFYRGKKEDLIFLNNYNIKPYIDLSKAKYGENIIKVSFDYSFLPESLKVTKIDPEYIKVNIDIKIIRELKVVFNIKNEPAEGYTVSDVILNSKYVKVEGPKSILENLEFIQFNDIDITGLESSEMFKIEPILPDIKLINPENVYVYIEIKKQFEFYNFQNLAIQILNKKREFEYILSPVSLNLQILVPSNLKTNLEIPTFIVDVSNFNEEGEYIIIPFLKINENYEIFNIEPSKVILKIIRVSRMN